MTDEKTHARAACCNKICDSRDECARHISTGPDPRFIGPISLFRNVGCRQFVRLKEQQPCNSFSSSAC